MRAAILFVPTLLLAASCASSGISRAERTPPPPAPVAAIAPQATELRLDVAELTCHSCAGQVAAGASRIPGVLRVSADILDHVLVVRYDPTRLTETALVAAIDRVVDSITE